MIALDKVFRASGMGTAIPFDFYIDCFHINLDMNVEAYQAFQAMELPIGNVRWGDVHIRCLFGEAIVSKIGFQVRCKYWESAVILFDLLVKQSIEQA